MKLRPTQITMAGKITGLPKNQYRRPGFQAMQECLSTENERHMALIF
jgi:hypothetical protein